METEYRIVDVDPINIAEIVKKSITTCIYTHSSHRARLFPEGVGWRSWTVRADSMRQCVYTYNTDVSCMYVCIHVYMLFATLSCA